MSRHAIFAAVVIAACVGGTMISSKSHAQSRTPPAGSSLAQTPPIDQKPKQYNALPSDQKRTYDRQVPRAAPAPGQ